MISKHFSNVSKVVHMLMSVKCLLNSTNKHVLKNTLHLSLVILRLHMVSKNKLNTFTHCVKKKILLQNIYKDDNSGEIINEIKYFISTSSAQYRPASISYHCAVLLYIPIMLDDVKGLCSF